MALGTFQSSSRQVLLFFQLTDAFGYFSNLWGIVIFIFHDKFKKENQ